MCRYDTQSFEPEVTETRAARRWIVDALRRWELDSLVEELELVGSELATNALLHTRSGFDVTLAACNGWAELAVRDRDPRAPVVRPARLDLLSDVEQLAGSAGEAAVMPTLPADAGDEERPGEAERHPSLHVGPSGSIAAGRGLLIVDAIADEWGVASHAEGKDVWMRVPLPADWPFLHECSCNELNSRTPSGRPVRHMHGDWDAHQHSASN